MVAEEIIEVSPLTRIERPLAREEIKQPLSSEEFDALLRAARASFSPKRNEAIMLMLIDFGVRANELLSLKEKDVDVKSGTLAVVGKGNKRRQISADARALTAVAKALTADSRPLTKAHLLTTTYPRTSGLLLTAESRVIPEAHKTIMRQTVSLPLPIGATNIKVQAIAFDNDGLQSARRDSVHTRSKNYHREAARIMCWREPLSGRAP